MAKSDPVDEFVREALTQGRSRGEVSDVLKNAGWSQSEIDDGLNAYADVSFSPPVPKPRSVLTARDAFIYAILFTALTFTAIYLINLIHANLDIFLPDAADGNYIVQRAERTIRWAIAILVISTPVYLLLTRHTRTRRKNREDAGQNRSLVRKWMTYLALFVAGLVFLGDASYTIYHFLNGEMTVRFLLKALTVATVSGGIFGFYLLDVWEDNRA